MLESLLSVLVRWQFSSSGRVIEHDAALRCHAKTGFLNSYYDVLQWKFF